MTELEESQKRQLDAAQKLIESYDKQVKDLKASLHCQILSSKL